MHRLTIASALTAIDEARQWVAAHAGPAGFGEYEMHDTELAMTEAIANVIEHAYAGEESHQIDLELEVGEGRLELSIIDHGGGFDAEDYAPPNLEEPAAGGYGVHLIDELMDEVERSSDPATGNRLRMVKKRA